MAMVKAERQVGITPEQQQAGYAEAQRYFEAAVLQQPNFLFATLNLGVLHAAVGNYDQADVFFAKAVAIDPNNLGARTSWAEVLEKQGRLRAAAFQWVAAVEIDRDDPALRQELAESYLNLGMLDEARAQIDQAIALDPIHARKDESKFHRPELVVRTAARAPTFRRSEPAFAMGSPAD
jgi:tetratricopeptide (TPR) repeat protein